jgi:large subunit ribosomal protein L13e
MVKHNNMVPNAHFHKDWQRYVRTWFNQPAKKVARRVARQTKAKQIAPRPLNFLRPAVRGQTVKYNRKVRAGRGFTLEELRSAKINKHEAKGLGIAVDHRRRNRSEESFTQNVNRLKLYKSKLVIFPRNPTSKRVKKGDSSEADLKSAKQVLADHVLPISQPIAKFKARKISKDEREATVTTVLRKALTDAKLKGVREKRAKDKADEAAGKKPKATDAAMEEAE